MTCKKCGEYVSIISLICKCGEDYNGDEELMSISKGNAFDEYDEMYCEKCGGTSCLC